jgi:hypothetical protein
MKVKSLHIVFSVILIILSCDENFHIVNCSECLTEEPTEAKIELKVDDIGGYNARVIIYEGNIEDSIVVRTDNIYAETMEFIVGVNKKYTFRVDYFDNAGTKYIAINEVYPRAKLELEQCKDFHKLNMKLKYN